MASVNGGAIAARKNEMANSPKKSMMALIQTMKPQIEKALPSVLTGERFTRMVLTALSTTPQLAECTPASFMGAMMQAAQLGVEPNTPLGQAYLIPYRNHGKLEAQFQLGYKGLIDLAYRSGEIADISAREVHESDEFDYEYGTNEHLYHKPARGERGPVTEYYGIWRSKNGVPHFEVMTVKDMKEYAKKYSKAASSSYSPWSTNFDAMAKKTVLKKALKYAPLKTEFVRGVAADGTIKSFKDASSDILDAPDENTYEAPEPENVTPEKREEPEVDPETGEIIPPNVGAYKKD